MKKTIASMICLMMILSLFAGCAQQTAAPAAEPAAQSAEPEAPAEQTAAPAEEATPSTSGEAGGKLAQIKEKGVITMATSPDFAPIEFIDPTKTGQESYVGSDVQLGYYIAEKLGVTLQIAAMDFSAVQAAVTTGDVDMAISGFAYTEERAQSMGLSDFYNAETEEGQGLLVLVEQKDQYTKAEDFNGKLIAAQNASLQYNLTAEQLPDAKIEVITNLNDAVMMLTSGKVDAVACSAEVAEGYAKNYSDVCLCDFYFDFADEGNVLAVTKGEDELLAAINEILAEVNEQGLYTQWKAEATELADSLGIEHE